MLTLAHSISLARSRSSAWFTSRRLRRAAPAMIGILDSVSSGGAPPYTLGQKYRSWRSAAEWKVRAWTAPAPMVRRRVRISPAARVVKVTARTSSGL